MISNDALLFEEISKPIDDSSDDVETCKIDINSKPEKNIDKDKKLKTNINIMTTKLMNSLNISKKAQKEYNTPKNFFSRQFIEQTPNDEKLFYNNKRIYLYKTELCRSYSELGFCKYGEKCQFSHSKVELRDISRHPKYKTETCRVFWEKGTCPYGKRCCFLHSRLNLDIDEPFEPKKQTLVSINKKFIKEVPELHESKIIEDFDTKTLIESAQQLSLFEEQKIKKKSTKIKDIVQKEFVFDLNEIDLNSEDELNFITFKNKKQPFLDTFFKIPNFTKMLHKKHFFFQKTKINNNIWS